MKVFLFITACLLSKSFCFGSAASDSTSLLWKITGNGLEKPSYLFGTWHTMPHQFLDRVPGFYDAFNSATAYAGEIDPTTRPSPEAYRRMEMPPDTTYANLLNKPDFDMLDSMVNKYLKGSVDEISCRPGPLAYFLYEFILTEELIKTDSIAKFVYQGRSLDGYLLKTAQNKHISTFALETFSDRERWGMLDLSGYGLYDGKLEDQIQELIAGIKKIISIDSMYLQSQLDITLNLARAYYEQNLVKYEYIYSQIELNEITNKIKEVTVKNRNIFWMGKIRPWFINYSDRTLFVAVGAGHLVGEYGLISLLRKEGYVVEPVTENNENQSSVTQ